MTKHDRRGLNEPIVDAAIRWRRSLDVALTALNVPARMLVEAVDTHTWRALNDARGFTEYMSGNSYAESYPGDDPACRPPANATAEVAGVRFSCTSCKCDVDVFRVQCGRCKFDAERSSYGLDERTPGQQATDYAAAAERDRQLVASRAEAKREVERLRAELTRERAKVASMEMAEARRGMSSYSLIVDMPGVVTQSKTDAIELRELSAEMKRERAEMATVVAVLEAERDSLRAKVHGAQADSRLNLDRAIAAEAERDALLVTVRMMARAGS